MQRKTQPWLFAIVLSVVMLAGANPAIASERYAGDTPSPAAMAADMLLVRPLGVVATVAGVAIFAVSLPFSILGDNVPAAEEQLVLKPGRFTFARPLGEFRDSFTGASSY